MSIPRIQDIRHTRNVAQPRPRAALDATWEAIVAQLLATPSDRQPHQAQPEREYAFARRLGMHINRPPGWAPLTLRRRDTPRIQSRCCLQPRPLAQLSRHRDPP